MNSYEIFKEIREGIGEESETHWSDRAILRKMNQAQKTLWQDLLKTNGDWFLTSEDLTPVDSVITLPALCGRAVYMEDKSDGVEIPLIGTVRERRLTRGTGTNPYEGLTSAYFAKDSLVVNADDFTDEVTLWYQERLLDMHFGTAGASSAASALHLDITHAPKFEDDYYNDLKVEVWSSASLPKIETTISDYAGATNIATIVGTAANGDFYGTIPQVPEEGHYLIVLDVVNKCLMKPGSNFDLEYLKISFSALRAARIEWLEWIEMRGSKHSYIAIGEID